MTYTSSNTNVATVLGSLVTIIGEGNTTITANQAGDSNWNPATSVTQTLTVQPAINRGLVAYYPFNGNANDESGNGRHGTVVGAVPSSNRYGVSNQAYLFSFTNYISAPVPVEILKTNYTLSLWVKADSLNSPYPTFVAGSSNRYVLQFNTNSAVTRLVSYYQDASSSAYPFGELVTTVPAYNQWNHVVISGTGGTNTRMFINGTLVSSLSHVYPAGISGSNFRLGSGNDNEITFFNGKLDDVRFYTRELTTAEVGQLYVQEAAPISETFGSGTNSFSMDFVRIGNPGNAADTTGSPNPAGSVSYIYNIGKYEVSRDQVLKANLLGSLGINLWDLTNLGGNGANKPATGVTWYDAAKFVNWLNTSQGFVPAYKFDGSGNFQLWSSTDSGYDPGNPYRNTLAKYFLPSVDEWYKAAYGSPSGTWYDYPTGSNIAPSPVGAGVAVNTAVYGGQSGFADVTNAGGLSAYGTMAQGGNVAEWNETAFDGINDSPSENRPPRGGAAGFWNNLSSTDFGGAKPSLRYGDWGFRVASSASLANPTGIAPLITSSNSLSGTVGVVFSNTVTASGSTPITLSASNLPAGLTNSTNGLITGTPTTAGTNNATLTASNSFGATNQSVTFVIAKGTPVISNWPTPSPITYGQALSNSVLTGGVANPTGNFTWT
ncbi:MAG: hypothetical protein EBS97_08110, partial [Verrucomicrobia bacterium]|nr:hypothetical protein [Verrucomicrobiota bacterium]